MCQSVPVEVSTVTLLPFCVAAAPPPGGSSQYPTEAGVTFSNADVLSAIEMPLIVTSEPAASAPIFTRISITPPEPVIVLVTV